MDVKFWQKAFGEAERELYAATTRTALDAAAKKSMRAKAELKRLELTDLGRTPATWSVVVCGAMASDRISRILPLPVGTLSISCSAWPPASFTTDAA